MSSEVPKKFFTIVYRVSSGDEAKALAEAGDVSVASWSHATDERDAAIAELQAVRAQWAAEVAKRDQEIADLIEAGKTWNAQRDSAQAEAKTLRGALETAVAALADGLWDYGPGQDEHDKCNEVLAFCRAALQPGASHDE